MKKVLAATLACVAAFSVEAKECTETDARTVESKAGHPKTWDALYSGFKQYGHCDEGGPSQVWSEAIIHLYTSSWSSLPKAAAFAQKDAAFRDFLLSHFRPTSDPDMLKAIAAHAQSQCPAEQKALCEDIGKSVKNALSGVEPGTPP